MVSIHLPSEDELEIVKIKDKFNSQLMKVISNEEEQKRLIKELAKRMQKTAKEKRKLIDIEKKLQDSLEIAIKNPSSLVKRNEITALQKSGTHLSNSLANQGVLADAFMDLSSAMDEFIKKKKDYQKLLENLLQIQRKWQTNTYRYLKDSNKFVSESKLRPLEVSIKDLEREMNRQQNLVDRRIESLLEESKSMDRAWNDVKSKIKEYGW